MHEAMLHTGSRTPQLCSQAATEHANKLSKQQSGQKGSFSEEVMGPGEERPSWHGERAALACGHRVQSRWRRQVPAGSQPEVAGGPGGLGDSGGGGASRAEGGGGGASRAEGGTGEVCSLDGLLLSRQCLLQKTCPSLSRAVFWGESRDNTSPRPGSTTLPGSESKTQHAQDTETEEEK